MNSFTSDTETDIYLLLSKLKKNGVLKEFHSFSNEVIENYLKSSTSQDVQINLLVYILNETLEKYNFTEMLSEYERELIGAMILGYLDGEE